MQNKAKGYIWHKCLGYTGKNTIENLLQLVMGMLLKGPTIVTDKLINKVSQLLVLVGLAVWQIGDIVTGQVQASHK